MYEDFFVRVNGDRDGYFVEAHGPGEISTQPVAMRLDAGTRNMLDRAVDFFSLTADDAKQVGACLYQALFRPEIRQMLAGSYQFVSHENKRLRLKLAVRPPDLGEWPWELLYDDLDAQFVSQRARYSLVRFVESSLPVASIAQADRLRLLYVSAEPADYPALGLQDSQKAVVDHPRDDLEVRPLPNATRKALRDALREGCDILHFDGHADFDAAQGEGFLLLCDEQRKSACLSGREFASYLDGADVRLVVLNACNTATGSTSVPLAGIAHRIMRASSIPAVVAMQQVIPDRLAIAFNRAFYRELTREAPVDEAILEGRHAIADELGEPLGWAIPVLFMRSRDGLIFQSLDERLHRLQAEVTETRQKAADAALDDLAAGLNALLARLQTTNPSKRQIPGLALDRWGEPEVVFGRQEDTRQILELLDPVQDRRLLLLFAEEGADAGDVLRAGVVARLIADGEVAVHLSLRDAEPGTLIRQAFLRDDATNRDKLMATPLHEFLRFVSTLVPRRRIVIVLDDLDTFFARDDAAARRAFLDELRACLEVPFLPVQWVLVVQEQNWTYAHRREIAPFVDDFAKEFTVERLDRDHAQGLIAGLVWKKGLDLDEEAVQGLLDQEDGGRYSPSQIGIEIDELEEPAQPTKRRRLSRLLPSRHRWSKWKYVEPNQCIKMRVCEKCGEIKQKSKPEHMWSEWHPDPDEGCKPVRVCTRCGETEHKRKPQHTWGEWGRHEEQSCQVFRVCAACGEQEAKKKEEHEWGRGWFVDTENQCTRTRVCERCGRVETRQQQHTWSPWEHLGQCQYRRHCVACGNATEDKIDHTWDAGEYASETGAHCKLVYTCIVCGAKNYVEESRHQWGGEVYGGVGTCDLVRVCQRCGYREDVGRRAHQWGEWILLDQSTNRWRRTCIRCGQTESKQF